MHGVRHWFRDFFHLGRGRLTILLAMFLSAALHLVLFDQNYAGWLRFDFFKQPTSPAIEVTLVAKQTAPKVKKKEAFKQVAKKSKKSKPVVKKPTPKPIKPQVIKQTSTPLPLTAVPAEAVVVDAEEVDTLTEVITEAPVETQKKVERVAEEVDTALPVIDEAVVQTYKTITSLYNVYGDQQGTSNRAVLGKAKMQFTAKDQQYALHSEVKASGIMGLFLKDLVQTSRGKVTQNGLKPEHFMYSYGNKRKKTYQVDFDWASQKIQLHTYKGVKTEALQVGTQDLLSFLFQFMYASPLNQTKMTITNGKAVRDYAYQFMGEVALETPLGVFNTVHIVRDDPVKNEKLELWLASDYQYLPVKIKKIKPQKNRIYELLIRALRTDQGIVQGEMPNARTIAAKAESDALEVATEEQENVAPETQQLNPFLQR